MGKRPTSALPHLNLGVSTAVLGRVDASKPSGNTQINDAKALGQLPSPPLTSHQLPAGCL